MMKVFNFLITLAYESIKRFYEEEELSTVVIVVYGTVLDNFILNLYLDSEMGESSDKQVSLGIRIFLRKMLLKKRRAFAQFKIMDIF